MSASVPAQNHLATRCGTGACSNRGMRRRRPRRVPPISSILSQNPSRFQLRHIVCAIATAAGSEHRRQTLILVLIKNGRRGISWRPRPAASAADQARDSTRSVSSWSGSCLWIRTFDAGSTPAEGTGCVTKRDGGTPLAPFRKGRFPMNWDQIEGGWKQLKGKAKEQWGRLTDDELDQAAGRARPTGREGPGALWLRPRSGGARS